MGSVYFWRVSKVSLVNNLNKGEHHALTWCFIPVKMMSILVYPCPRDVFQPHGGLDGREKGSTVDNKELGRVSLCPYLYESAQQDV